MKTTIAELAIKKIKAQRRTLADDTYVAGQKLSATAGNPLILLSPKTLDFLSLDVRGNDLVADGEKIVARVLFWQGKPYIHADALMAIPCVDVGYEGGYLWEDEDTKLKVTTIPPIK